MKVWNKNINSCCECYHCDGDSCNITKEFLNNRSEIINNNCPFAQPITKEVIEGFGFNYYRQGWSKDSSIYRSNRGVGYEIYSRNNESFHITQANGTLLFEGKLNNKIELEFILRSIGVIE